MDSKKRSKAASSYGSMFGATSRRRKGNLEDLIHQFIIQDQNVMAPKPMTPSKDETFKAKLKKSKIDKDNKPTPSKDSATKSKISNIVDSEDDNDHLAPMFPDQVESTPKKVSSKKTPTKSDQKRKESAKKEPKKEPEKKAEPKSKSKSSYYKKSKKEKSKKGENKETEVLDDEAAGMDPAFFFDDNKVGENQEESKLPYWLQNENIVDDQGHKPDEEDYNPATLSIPTIEYDQLPAVHKKYWQFKSKYFDKVVAFKMWACYFFYANDALLMHRQFDMHLGYYLGRIYSYCHETALFKAAPKLLSLGYKLVILKQPEGKEETEKLAREVFQVLSRGTYTENTDITYASQFCLCIYEQKDDVGLIYFDATTHEFYIGEFKDDPSKNNLKTILMKIKPVEVVYLRNFLSQETQNFIKNLPSKPILSQIQIPEEKSRSISSNLDEIIQCFAPRNENMPLLPELLNTIKTIVDIELSNRIKNAEANPDKEIPSEQNTSHYFTIKAVSICLSYLKDLMLEDTIFSQGTFSPYDLVLQKKSTLYLDSQALLNLEILDVEYLNSLRENQSLFGYMDKTVSQFGKRMFKSWLVSPLLDVKAINERLQAVEDLLENDSIAEFYQSQIKELPDLERIVSRIYNLASKKRVMGIRFEDFVKNKLLEFLNVLEQLEKVESIITRFEPFVEKFKSGRLKELVTFRELENFEEYASKKKVSKPKSKVPTGIFPRVGPLLLELRNMVRVKDGLLLPKEGLDKNVDDALAKIEAIKEHFLTILEEQKTFFQCRWIKYVHTRQRYELEIPEDVLDKVQKPKEYVITSKKKGFIRLHTPMIEEALNDLRSCEYDLNTSLAGFISQYFRKFYDKNVYWRQIIACLAELDCICSLAKFARTMNTCCRPEVLPPSDRPIFELKDMVHPCIAPLNPNFVSNDFVVEGDVDTFLITGPNMGGKSTLLRQICIAVVMAQAGSFVPASSFRFSVVDRIFTRIGASDRIVEGKSTFFVELEETYNILMEASRNSLVVMDELGRGTSTYDGVAIAYATLKHIAEKIRCITLFATHYHLLLEEFRLYNNITSYHMASELNKETDEIEFKYKFIKGQADKSHGVAIAKMAGLPGHVLHVAKEKAAFMTNEKRNIGFQKSLIDKFNRTIEELERAEELGFDEVEYTLEELSHL